MQAMTQTAIRLYTRLLAGLNALQPVMMLIARLWIVRVFFVSGWLKISDWGNTIALFTQEFKVPLLPPQGAAVMSATVELSCPVLLALGLASRLATLPLLAMTAVINFTYEHSPEHYYWAMLLGMILCFGPGKLSVDYWIGRKWKPNAP